MGLFFYEVSKIDTLSVTKRFFQDIGIKMFVVFMGLNQTDRFSFIVH